MELEPVRDGEPERLEGTGSEAVGHGGEWVLAWLAIQIPRHRTPLARDIRRRGMTTGEKNKYQIKY